MPAQKRNQRQLRYEKLRDDFNALIKRLCEKQGRPNAEAAGNIKRLELELSESKVKLGMYSDQLDKIKENVRMYKEAISRL